MKTISVAIPCYKSENTIKLVVEEIKKTISQKQDYDYQIILINDYPFDNTFNIIKQMCKEDEKIIGVNLTKNFGQTTAKMTAIKYAKGDVLVFMDDDGQHPASEIFKLIEKVEDGYDIVYAHFKEKKHSLFKKITSYINSKMLEINGTKQKGISVSSYHALSKVAYESLKDYHSPFPSMLEYLNYMFQNQANVEITHKERIFGKSNYNLKKLISLWLTGFTNFSLLPLRIMSILGGIFSSVGFLFGILTIIKKLIIPNIQVGYTSTISIIIFIGGILMIMLGLIGEYVGRIYMTVSNLPQYRIREVINENIKK